MNDKEVRKLLDDEWARVLRENVTTPDREIDQFIESPILGIRYACITQLLGKIADPSRHLLSLQKTDNHPGAWNARSFSAKVIVPWVADNHAVLGTSGDPYVSNALRRTTLTDLSGVRHKEQWTTFANFLRRAEEGGEDFLFSAFRRCLKSIARKLQRQSFEYPIPQRISLHNMSVMLTTFLAEPSNGLRPLVVATALFRILGEAFSLFSNIQSQGLNEADSASGVPGDIVCYGKDDTIALAVEVKDYHLTLHEYRNSVTKALKGNGISRLLFATPGIDEGDRQEIERRMETQWASGLNVYQVNLEILVKTTFSLLEEEWRIKFIREVGKELDTRGVHLHRERWRHLLVLLQS